MNDAIELALTGFDRLVASHHFDKVYDKGVAYRTRRRERKEPSKPKSSSSSPRSVASPRARSVVRDGSARESRSSKYDYEDRSYDRDVRKSSNSSPRSSTSRNREPKELKPILVTSRGYDSGYETSRSSRDSYDRSMSRDSSTPRSSRSSRDAATTPTAALRSYDTVTRSASLGGGGGGSSSSTRRDSYENGLSRHSSRSRSSKASSPPRPVFRDPFQPVEKLLRFEDEEYLSSRRSSGDSYRNNNYTYYSGRAYDADDDRRHPPAAPAPRRSTSIQSGRDSESRARDVTQRRTSPRSSLVPTEYADARDYRTSRSSVRPLRETSLGNGDLQRGSQTLRVGGGDRSYRY